MSNGRLKRGQDLPTSCWRVWPPESSQDSTDKFKGSGKNYFGVELAESAYIFNIGNVKQCVREKPAQFFKLYSPLFCISNPTESEASAKSKTRKSLICLRTWKGFLSCQSIYPVILLPSVISIP